MWQAIKNVYHLVVTILANLWFGFPSKKLTVIGVTGTDGKTTTVNLICHILKTAGRKASMVSSVGAVINGKVYDTGFHVTTPSSWQLQKFLREAVSAGTGHLPHVANDAQQGSFKASSKTPSLSERRHQDSKNKQAQNASAFSSFASGQASIAPHCLVLEVTSHALDQNRVFGIKFDIGVLTNVTHEHLDYHKDFEEYVQTKFRLLGMAQTAVVNRDDESHKFINSKLKSQKLITYGMGQDADVNPKSFSFKTKLIGEFNKYNILAAVAACKELGLTDSQIRKGVESFKAPVGRGEVVYEGDFTVMIDFAHTPNALEQLLSSIRKQVKGRIIHVFGSAGERDRQKRPQMGRVSAKYADIIVLTAEDPRSEEMEKITGEIEVGIKNYESRIENKTLFKTPNRQEAINTAIKMAKKGDLVLLTGKGHERSMNYGKGEIAWSEHEAVEKALKR